MLIVYFSSSSLMKPWVLYYHRERERERWCFFIPFKLPFSVFWGSFGKQYPERSPAQMQKDEKKIKEVGEYTNCDG